MKKTLLKQLEDELNKARVKEARSGLEIFNTIKGDKVSGTSDLLAQYARDQGFTNGLYKAMEILLSSKEE